MPTIFNIAGYKIYFYSNENDEPCHIHITQDYKSNSKIWIEPEIKVANNDAGLPKKDLKIILRWAKDNKKFILAQ